MFNFLIDIYELILLKKSLNLNKNQTISSEFFEAVYKFQSKNIEIFKFLT